MAVNLSFIGGAGWQFFDDNGVPLAGGKIYTYVAGTTTPAATYTSRDGLTTNTNPIILDAAGRTPQQIWSTEGALYKYVVKTSADVLIRSWDNIGGSVVASDLQQDLADTTDNTLGDALVGFRQSNAAGFLTGAVASTVSAKLRDVVTPADFGAVGDGVTDDTQALRLWLSTDAGVHMLGGPDKTYLVNPPVTGNVILPIASNRRLTIVGDGATIKIANSSFQYTAILGSNTTSDDLSDLVVRGVIFDQNSSNNTFPVTGNVLTYPHFTICVRRGSNIRLENNTVENAVCTNSFCLNGNDNTPTINVRRVFITENAFLNIGGSANAQDHSTIYLHADDFMVHGNYGEGASLGATGTAAFIETHGTRQHVTDNAARNFVGFANITGIYNGGDSENSFVSGNHGIALLEHGVRLFSTTYQTHTTGYGIIGLTISNNRMRIYQSSLGAGTANFYMGYAFQSGASLPVKDVQIINNVVEYDAETIAPAYTALSCAVGANETSGTNVYENLVISGNTIINAPAAAIGLGSGGGVFKDCVIGPNTIINPGQSLSASVPATFKTALLGICNQFTGSLKVARQTITDTFAVTRMVYGSFFLPTNSSTTIPCEVDLDIVLAGDKVAFSTPVQNSSSRLSMTVYGRQNKPLAPTGETFLAGSTVFDTSENITYRVQSTGTLWTDHGYSDTAPTTGTHQVGSTRTYVTPTAGGFFGRVCTTAGTPGTWRTWGVIF